MKKLIALKLLILIIMFGCTNESKVSASLWSLDLNNIILGDLKTSNYLLSDNAIVLYSNKKLIKADTKSDRIFWENSLDKNLYTTHIKQVGTEILVCGFYNKTSYLFFVNYESGEINSIDTFPSIIESIYQIGNSSNFIIYQQNITEESYFLELSEYNYKTKKSLWKIEGIPLFTEPYVDSNYLVFPKIATSAYCVNRISKESTVFPIDAKDTFALIQIMNKEPKWQLVNLIKGTIDTTTIWDFKFVIDKDIFVAKIGDNKLYQVSLNAGGITPFIELPDKILCGSSYGTNILLYSDKKKVALIDVLTKKIRFMELKFEPFLGKNSVLLYKDRVFYYEGHKILGEAIN